MEALGLRIHLLAHVRIRRLQIANGHADFMGPPRHSRHSVNGHVHLNATGLRRHAEGADLAKARCQEEIELVENGYHHESHVDSPSVPVNISKFLYEIQTGQRTLNSFAPVAVGRWRLTFRLAGCTMGRERKRLGEFSAMQKSPCKLLAKNKRGSNEFLSL